MNAVSPTPGSPTHLVAPFGAAVAVGGALAAWLSAVPGPVLREQLTVAQRPVLDLVVLVALTTAALAGGEIARWLRQEAGVRWTQLAAVAALAMFVTLAVPPRTNRIYYDEQIYQSVAQNMSRPRARPDVQRRVGGVRAACSAGAASTTSSRTATRTSSACCTGSSASARASRTAWNLFATSCWPWWCSSSRRWRGGTRAPGCSPAPSSRLLPQQLLWSRTAASEPSAALFSAAGRLRVAGVRAAPLDAGALFAVAMTAWGVQFRPESVLLRPGRSASSCWRPCQTNCGARASGGPCCSGSSSARPRRVTSSAVRNENWGTTGDRLSLAYLADNLRVNGWFYLRDERFPWIVTALRGGGPRRGVRHWRQATL